MIKINYESDFKLVETVDEYLVNVPFTFTYTTNEQTYTASYNGETYVNCKRNSDGSIVVIFNKHGLGVGKMKVRREFLVADADLPDGVYNVVSNDTTDILLVEGKTESIVVSSVVMLPIDQPPEEEEEEGEPEWVESFTFIDGVDTEFVNQNTKIVGTLTYKRANMPTTWTSIYLPFEVPVKVLAEQGFDVAYINGVRREDTNYDGELDNFVTDVIYIHCQRTVGDNEINIDGTSKTLKANYPYFVRSIDIKKELNIVLGNVKLYAAQDKSYVCTTMTEKYEITGNSSQMTIVNKYAVSGGGWSYLNRAQPLKPFRFYMEISHSDGSAPVISEVVSEG